MYYNTADTLPSMPAVFFYMASTLIRNHDTKGTGGHS